MIRQIESGALALGRTKVICLSVLIAAFSSVLAGRGAAQTLTTIYSFNGDDGSAPQGGLIVSSNTLYGTTLQGGVDNNSAGVVFALSTDGTGFTNLHTFTGIFISTDGALPIAGLLSSGTTLYGTTQSGGGGLGTVFSVNTDGSGYSVLYSFTAFPDNPPQTNADGAVPDSGLVLSGETLYGTAEVGGTMSYGTLFAININGMGFTNLHNFNSGKDGAFPSAGLLLSGDLLYGTTEGFSVSGGGVSNSTVFVMGTDDFNFNTLHLFTPTRLNSSGVYTNSDGTGPEGELILSGSKLYGTAAAGGTLGQGTVFTLNTNGSGFVNLHNFNGTSDGAFPSGPVVLRGNTLYGTTQYGGSSSNGTVFAVNTDGTGFTNLYSFTAPVGPFPFTNSDGANPAGGLTLLGNALYGTAASGGSFGRGTVFSISLPVLPASLTITPSEANIIVTWSTNATGFTLQSTTNLGSPIWTANLPSPVVVNGLNTVTNRISGSQQFFRLSQ